MGSLLHWLDSAVSYVAMVTGLSALSFVAMRLLA